MKLRIGFILFITMVIIRPTFSQEPSLIVIGGMRINPMVVYNSKGDRFEFTRIHTEIGALKNKNIFASIGYTPFLNNIYTFNEYWFFDLNSPRPISLVSVIEYNFDNDRAFYNFGFNFKFKGGNGIILWGSRFDAFDPMLKIGAFLPMSWVLYKK